LVFAGRSEVSLSVETNILESVQVTKNVSSNCILGFVGFLGSYQDEETQ
jgi:hypothetical protein